MDDDLIRTIMRSVDPARDLSDEALNELLPLDKLMAKIALGTAADVDVPAPSKSTSKRRVVPIFVGASAAVGSIIVAGALLLFGSSPALIQSTGVGTKTSLPSPVLKIEPRPLISGTSETYNYVFTASPSLSSAGGSVTAYELSSPPDVAAAARKIATSLGVSGPLRLIGPGNYQAGPSTGPDVTVAMESGVLTWQFPTWTDASPNVGVSVEEGAPIPSDAQATAAARQVLLSIDVNLKQLGAPLVSRYSGAVNVQFPMVVAGLTTGQYSQVSYGPGATVLTASGIIATATPSASYQAISPNQAVSLLTSGSEITSDGGSGRPGGSGSGLVTVLINEASPGFAAYVLRDGTSWLLPTWVLSGPESGSSIAIGSKYLGSVLAVPSQYVDLQSSLR